MLHESFKKEGFSLCIKVNKENIQYYIESNPSASINLPIIASTFPNYKVIWIIRNGKDWVRSSFSKYNEGNNEAYVFDKHEPIDRLTAKDIANDSLGSNWDSLDRFEKVCWNWVAYNKIIEEFAINNNNLLQIKFEEIFNKEQKFTGINKIIDFLDLRNNLKVNEKDFELQMNVKKNVNETYLLSKNFQEWDSLYQDKFIAICGETMEKYGYSVQS